MLQNMHSNYWWAILIRAFVGEHLTSISVISSNIKLINYSSATFYPKQYCINEKYFLLLVSVELYQSDASGQNKHLGKGLAEPESSKQQIQVLLKKNEVINKKALLYFNQSLFFLHGKVFTSDLCAASSKQ